MKLTAQVRRHVLGKRITEVRLHRFYAARAGETATDPDAWSYAPVFVLEDGTEIHFVVDETETGEYGITPVIRPPWH